MVQEAGVRIKYQSCLLLARSVCFNKKNSTDFYFGTFLSALTIFCCLSSFLAHDQYVVVCASKIWNRRNENYFEKKKKCQETLGSSMTFTTDFLTLLRYYCVNSVDECYRWRPKRTSCKSDFATKSSPYCRKIVLFYISEIFVTNGPNRRTEVLWCPYAF